MRLPRFYLTHLITTWALYILPCHSKPSSKRGLAYLGDDHKADTNLLLSAQSPIGWYYTWSLNQAPRVNDTTTFVPLIHSTNDASNPNLNALLNRLPASSTHLLTFNEPDGTKDSGGSSIEPEDAARAYINHVAPLRRPGSNRSWNISHPSVTGSGQGLDWLRRFNASCYELDAEAGCPTDFVAVHWYGDFGGLASWLGTLRDFYVGNATEGNGGRKDLKFWVTEMALPQHGADATVAMMNQSLAYLDGLDDVESYAWFGAFRTNGANEWTGNAVSLFDDGGGLTKLGSIYLGGEQNGFAEGTKGVGESAARSLLPSWMVLLGTLALATLV